MCGAAVCGRSIPSATTSAKSSTIREAARQIIDIEAMESSGIVGKALSESKLPHGAMVGAIVRDGQVVIPRPDTVIKPADRVILFAIESVIKKVERIFAVSLEHF